MVHPWAKYDKNPPRGSWDFMLTRFSYGRKDGRTTQKHNASGALRVGGIKIHKCNKLIRNSLKCTLDSKANLCIKFTLKILALSKRIQHAVWLGILLLKLLLFCFINFIIEYDARANKTNCREPCIKKRLYKGKTSSNSSTTAVCQL